MDKHQLQQRLGYFFTNTNLLDQALTHRSHGARHNERLEFLGDSLLGVVISRAIYTRYPDANEGHLSRMRAYLVRGETLCELALTLQLPKLLRLGAGERKSGGNQRESILANSFEALIAAIYLDSNSFTTTAGCIEQLYVQLLDRLEEIVQFKDPKSRLQEWLQARREQLPVYSLEAESGDHNNPDFTIACQVPLLDQPIISQAGNKRRAEQLAAAKALEQLEKLMKPRHS